MRSRWVFGASLTVLGVVAWLVLSARPDTRGASAQASRSPESPASAVLQALLQASSPESASEHAGLAIQGLVRSPKGPVPGARVLASRAVQGETLSTLPCAPGQRLTECLGEEHGEQFREEVEARRGEALMQARAVTASDGSFSLPGLEAGTYTLWVESEEGVALPSEATAGGPPVELNLRVGVRLSGTVKDDASNSVPGVLVTAVFASHSRFFETLTDATGNFQLGPLPPGEFLVVIAKEGLVTAFHPLLAYTSEVKRDFQLKRPQRITGRVLLGKASVAGAEVQARTEDFKVLSTTTDAEGRFSFEGLPPANYVLAAWHAGRGASAMAFLKESLVSRDVDRTLRLAPSVFIEGVVRDEAHQPVEQVRVQFLPEAYAEADLPPEEESRGRSDDDPTGYLAIALTDSKGHYRIGPVPTGTYALWASASGYLKPEEPSRELAAGVASWDFTLESALSFEGTLLDSEGLSVEGERVTLRATGEGHGWDDGTTGPDGHFALHVSHPGSYTLRLEGRKVHPQELHVTVPGEPLRIIGERLLHLMGAVEDAEGTPLPGVSVGLWLESDPVDESSPATATTDSGGRFSLHVDTPGRYRVTAEVFLEDFLLSTSGVVDVGEQGEAHVRLRFEEGRRISGVVMNWHGQPMERVAVQISPAPRTVGRPGCGWSSRCVRTDEKGRFSFRQASGEQFNLCIRNTGYFPLEAVPEDENCVRAKNDGQEVRIMVGRDVFVTGQVLHQDGSPVERYLLNGREVEAEHGALSLRIRRPGVDPIELSAPGLQTVRLTAPEFPEGVELQDIGDIVLRP